MVPHSRSQDGLVAECLQALRSTLAGIGLLSLPINLLMLTGSLLVTMGLLLESISDDK